MLRSAVAIAGIIGLTAISHRLLRHYLTPSKSQTHKPQSQDKNENKVGCTEPEAMIANSDGNLFESQGKMSNSNVFDPLGQGSPIPWDVFEALADPNFFLIGVYGPYFKILYALRRRFYKRVQRKQLFDIVVTADVTKDPDVWMIQEDIARQLGFTFKNIFEDERAKELSHMIKNEKSILIVLCDLYNGFDPSNVGIPYGADHTGCKILLTSTDEDLLSKHMHTQINFTVDDFFHW